MTSREEAAVRDIELRRVALGAWMAATIHAWNGRL